MSQRHLNRAIKQWAPHPPQPASFEISPTCHSPILIQDQPRGAEGASPAESMLERKWDEMGRAEDGPQGLC